MTARPDNLDRQLEQRLAARWASPDVDHAPDTGTLASWVDQPAPDEQVEDILARDPDLRRTVTALRLGTLAPEPPSTALLGRLYRLVPEPTPVLARIGGWAAVAAAIVVVAVAGYRLGAVDAGQRSMQEAMLAAATFGLSADNDDDFVGMFETRTEEVSP